MNDPVELDLVSVIYFKGNNCSGRDIDRQYWALNDDDFDNLVNTEAALTYCGDKTLKFRVEQLGTIKIPQKYFGDGEPYIS